MRSRSLKRWLVIVAVPATMTLAFAPASGAAAAAHPGRTARGAEHQYIVILRNQNPTLGARSAARRSAVRAEQAPVLAQIHSLGGHSVGSTSLVNAVIAKLTAGGAQALAADPAVAKVVPDGVIQGPTSPTAPAGPSTKATGATLALSPQLCGTATEPAAQSGGPVQHQRGASAAAGLRRRGRDGGAARRRPRPDRPRLPAQPCLRLSRLAGRIAGGHRGGLLR